MEDLAELEQWACFGERALLRDELRFAGVVATSELTCLRISREGFEAALGAAPRELLREEEYLTSAPKKRTSTSPKRRGSNSKVPAARRRSSAR